MAMKRIIQQSEHERVITMYKSGRTLVEVGEHFGVSRERIRQIVSAHGISSSEGGRTIRSLKNTCDKAEKRRSKNERMETRARMKWGMSLDDYRVHIAQYGSTFSKSSPMHKYACQRKNARLRGIAWQFTFPEWWSVWQESGKWSERGQGKYVMARYGDADTPYSKDTVYICTQSENTKDGYIVSPASVRFANNPMKAGTGKGWYYAPSRSKPNPYYAQFNKKHLGGFPTAEMARAAYEAAVEQHKKKS